MNASSRHAFRPGAFPAVSRASIRPLHLLLLGALSLGAIAWGWLLVSGPHDGDFLNYLLLAGLFGAASSAFIFSRIRENHLRFFDIPVFLTILLFVEFGLAPLECFVGPGRLEYEAAGRAHLLPEALACVMAGMAAFWAGAIVAERKRRGRGEEPGRGPRGPGSRRARTRILEATVVIYGVASAARVYLFTHHLYSYLASATAYWNNLASVQVLMAAAEFGTYALVIACIERYLDPADAAWRLLFWTIFGAECLWGLVSGAKGALLENLVIVALVSGVIQRRFRKGWIVAALLGAIALYPVSNAYRNLTRAGLEPVGSVDVAAETGREALRQTSQATGGVGGEIESGFRSTWARLDLLQNVGSILALGPGASQILGAERWWMLPFYPFIPRILWPAKPALVEGARFSMAVGYGRLGSTAETVGTSTAVTYPGDLYIRGGLAGVVAGMFLLGVAGEWLTGAIRPAANRRALFLYGSIFLAATDVELDAFSFWTGLVKTFVLLSILAWLVYGPAVPASGTAAAPRAQFARI